MADYQLVITLGTGATEDQLADFLDAVAAHVPALAMAGRVPGRLEAAGWIRSEDGGKLTLTQVYDAAEWAAVGTPTLLALQRLAADPDAPAWRMLPGRVLHHPEAGICLMGRPGTFDPWEPVYQVP